MHLGRAELSALCSVCLAVGGCSLSTAGASSSAGSSASSAGSGGGAPGGSGAVGGASTASSTGGEGGTPAGGGAGGESAAGGGPAGCDAADDFADGATGHCYRLFTMPASYPAADEACAAWKIGGRLAAVGSDAELGFIDDELSDGDFWIGADDLLVKDVWVWLNGEVWGDGGWAARFEVFPWANGEPSGAAAERCLRMKGWEFESKDCADAKPYLCELH
jgi:hypothetical protein